MRERPGGRLAHEVLVPLTVRAEPSGDRLAVATIESSSANECETPRTVSGGRVVGVRKTLRWGGTCDRLLTDVIGPVSRELIAGGNVERWFFIRYGNPDDHLRWRLQVPTGTPSDHVRHRLEQIVHPLHEAGLVRQFTFDTYEREVERYGGGEAMTLAEQWFWADSDAIVRVLEDLGRRGDAASELRWRVGIVGTDTLLTDLGLDLEARARVMRTMRDCLVASSTSTPRSANSSLQSLESCRRSSQRCWPIMSIRKVRWARPSRP